MSVICGFDNDRLDRSLERLGVRFMRTTSGTAYAVFSPARHTDPEIQVYFSAQGADEEILVVRATMPRYFPAEQWPQLLATINNWHRNYRWPKCYLDFHPEHPERPPLGQVVAEMQWDLGPQVHDELLDRTLGCAIAAGHHFLSEVNAASLPDSPSAPTVEELEDWLRDQPQ